MIIDFHTHIFPDAIAPQTIDFLEKQENTKAFSDGTLEGLKSSMAMSGVDYSVVLPVVTKKEQFATINDFAAKISEEEGIFSFGGIHPDEEKVEERLDEICRLGLPGIKLHPDYQKTYADDEKYVRIVSGAIERGLHVVFHAGVDVGFPSPVYCTPERAVALLDRLPGYETAEGRLIFAHTGGYLLWDQVEELLVGRPIYFDLSFSLSKIEDTQLMRIIENHGCDRVLFATDSPWDSQKQDVEVFSRLALSQEEKDHILYENAQQLLKRVW